jgi:hypothetical protein
LYKQFVASGEFAEQYNALEFGAPIDTRFDDFTNDELIAALEQRGLYLNVIEKIKKD